MSSPYYCSPPIHGASLSGKVYLVTSPQAKAPGHGVYSSWEPAQRVLEGVTRGGAHDHPANPQSGQSAPIPAPMATPVAPVLPATPVTPRRSCPVASATPKSRAPAPAAALQRAAVAALRYAISGTGIVYTDLTDALDHFERVDASRPTTFLTTEDSRYAAHFAAGHSEAQARALAEGERLANEVETRWDGGYLPNAKRHLNNRTWGSKWGQLMCFNSGAPRPCRIRARVGSTVDLRMNSLPDPINRLGARSENHLSQNRGTRQERWCTIDLPLLQLPTYMPTDIYTSL
ncbi:hypothetical protein C8R47DRAFT_1071685 [Mycena vitilis]|nr:hypothetical protein C8R47DRAFT_1071685 [Mycena vitilis]